MATAKKSSAYIIYTEPVQRQFEVIAAQLKEKLGSLPQAGGRSEGLNISFLAENALIRLARNLNKIDADTWKRYIEDYTNIKSFKGGRKPSPAEPKKKHEGEKNVVLSESSKEAIEQIIAHIRKNDLAIEKVSNPPPTKKANQKLAVFIAVQYAAENE